MAGSSLFIVILMQIVLLNLSTVVGMSNFVHIGTLDRLKIHIAHPYTIEINFNRNCRSYGMISSLKFDIPSNLASYMMTINYFHPNVLLIYHVTAFSFIGLSAGRTTCLIYFIFARNFYYYITSSDTLL